MATIDEALKTNFQNDTHRFVANVIFTSGWIKSLFVDFLKPFGLTSPQYNILRILKGAKDWVPMSEIKELMIEKSPNTTRLVDKLLKKELVERQRSEADRRIVYIQISSQGLALLKEIDEKNVGPQVDFMDRVTESEARQVCEILDRLRG